eukprot:TRINITY_DN42537_c0_g1_i1.p1 TRINITY_DN42537_c0_g1~~TRINITY_DN42537_c0_g1_i1.p1  ORF type:complete len:439 (+),score=122.94 TRINITY_DN42537_c0_g1_i1:92-1408(+)
MSKEAPAAADAQKRALQITAGAHVVFRDTEGGQKVQQVVAGKDVKIGKYPVIPVDVLLGLPFGATLRWEGNSWCRRKPIGMEDVGLTDSSLGGEALKEVAEDNRSFAQDNTAQTLKPDEINELKRACTGEEVVAKIAENNATFASKTQFSKEKYIKKKQQKHVQQVSVLRPTVMELCETYMKISRGKMCGLRWDYLSSILCHAHVHPGGNFMVLDGTMGLVAGALAQQMAGDGRVFRLFSGGCSDKALQELDMSEECRTSVRQLPLDVLQSKAPLESAWAQPPAALAEGASEEEKTRHQGRTARIAQRRADLGDVLEAGFDGVVIVADEDSAELASDALDVGLQHLTAGGRLAVFGHLLQPLANRQGAMKASGEWVDVRLIQLWTREYQVLPLRTHPHMAQDVHHCEGFLLVGTRVVNVASIAAEDVVEPATKKRRTE